MRVLRFYGASMTQRARSIAAVMLALILASASAIAGCSDAHVVQEVEPSPNPLLFEIADADGAVEGWMFGTIHALPAATNWRTPALSAAVAKADFLLVEIATIDNRAALAQTFAELSTTPGQPTIELRVPSELAPALNALMERGDFNTGNFSALETWAAALTLAQVGADADPANGADLALIRDFARRPVRELEGARGQLSIFDQLPEAQQRALLTAVVAGAEGSSAQAAKLRRGWLTGDAVALENATTTGVLADPDLRKALLIQRNRDWATKIGQHLRNEPRPLIAVGAAHLVGADGLVSLLQAQGYRVRRIP